MWKFSYWIDKWVQFYNGLWMVGSILGLTREKTVLCITDFKKAPCVGQIQWFRNFQLRLCKCIHSDGKHWSPRNTYGIVLTLLLVPLWCQQVLYSVIILVNRYAFLSRQQRDCWQPSGIGIGLLLSQTFGSRILVFWFSAVLLHIPGALVI